MSDQKMERFFYLKRLGGDVLAKVVVDPKEAALTCWNGVAWKSDDEMPIEWEFVAHVYYRFDGCTHWWFFGEDNDGTGTDRDSYYHICGPECLLEIMRCQAFVWWVCALLQKEDVRNEYYLDNDSLNIVTSGLLAGCAILEETNDTCNTKDGLDGSGCEEQGAAFEDC